MNSLAMQAAETLQFYDMLQSGSVVIAGLSGGADSVALLHWLCSLREGTGLVLSAAHVNHGLRGQQSDADEAFCRDICAQWNVPLAVLHADAAALAQVQGIGLEEAGRQLRYAFFGECAGQYPQQNPAVALAHTLSDRAETFLMNAARGAALRGLCSIPPKRMHSAGGNAFFIVRPLIECSRTQVEAYCHAHGLAYRTDASNADTGFRRNHIRHNVLPLLHPQDAPLRRMFRSLEADEAYLQAQAQQYEGELAQAPQAIKGRLLRDALEAQGREPTQARMREMEKQAVHSSGKTADLQFFPEKAQKSLHIEELDENFIKILRKNPKEGLANCLDYDTINGDLIAGLRLPGDSMRLCNGAGTKSFKKLCQERGIPAQQRQNILIARDDKGLVWIEGFGCAHRCRITETTRRALRLTASTAHS